MNGDECTDCGHDWGEHSVEVGCRSGWGYTIEGLAYTDGCPCKLAHVERSNHDG